MSDPHTTDFNLKQYIESTYKNSTDYDLQDSLINVRHSMSENHTQAKSLVTKHFDKFIECRSVVDSVHTHVKSNKQLQTLNAAFTEKMSKIDVLKYDVINKQYEIRKKFSRLFTLECDLRASTSHEEFVYLNSEAHKVKKTIFNSRFLDKVWRESDDLRKSFLNEMVDEIENKNNSFEDMTHFFDMYFEIERMRDLEISDCDRFKIEKIENTILINVKYDIEKSFEENDLLGSIDECKIMIRRVFKYNLRDEIKEEVIKCFIGQVLVRLEIQDEVILRIVKKEIDEIIENVSENSNSTLKYKCLNKLDEVEDRITELIIYAIIEDCSDNIDKWCDKFENKIKKCVEMCGLRKAKKIKEIAMKVLNKRIEMNKIEEIKYIKTVFIDKGMKVLNQKICDFTDVFDSLREKEDNNLKEIIEKIKNDFREIKIKSADVKVKFEIDEYIVPETMMRVLKVIDEFPLNYKIIIRRVSDQIDSKICLFFLKDICAVENFELIDEEKVVYEKYKKAFGFLMEKDYDIFDNNEDNYSKGIDFDQLSIENEHKSEKNLRMDDKKIEDQK